MAGLTATFDAVYGRSYSAPWKERRGYFTFDSSYALGGETGSSGTLKGTLGLNQVVDLHVDTHLGYSFEWDKTNDKVKAYWTRLGLAAATIGVKHDASASSTGVAIYVHVDEVIEQGTVLAHLECANAGTADSYFTFSSSGGAIPVQYDASAASGGTTLFFDEDDTAGLRFSSDFDRITGSDTSPAVLIQCNDGRYMRIKDQDTPSGETGTVQVYFDDDAANDYQRLLFVSPTTTSGTDRAWTYGGEVPNATDLSSLTPRFVAQGK